LQVLIVDDSRAMRLIVRRSLRQAGFGGHDFSEAASAEDALVQVQTNRPDVALLDWNMPGMSGIELVERHRAAFAGVRFGFVTSEASVEMRERATKAGAKFFITKPFTAEGFMAHLKGIL
jgi:two-component system chemotaxis response regulator CheY